MGSKIVMNFAIEVDYCEFYDDDDVDWGFCWRCCRFHVLSDFDEGKRSCRRKLERHNTRRRRKAVDSAVGVDNEVQTVTQNDDSNCDGELGIGWFIIFTD